MLAHSVVKTRVVNAHVVNTHIFPSDLGWMALAWIEKGLARFTFGHPSAAAAIASLEADSSWTTTRAADLPAWVADLASRLAGYASGGNEQFDDVPLDLSHLTTFQRTVVAKCRRINRGKTRSYGELAAAAGSPGAARAVGSVMAKNRFPIIIPCHRVVGAGKSLGGFSAPDGLNMKRRMLALEGYEPMKPRSITPLPEASVPTAAGALLRW